MNPNIALLATKNVETILQQLHAIHPNKNEHLHFVKLGMNEMVDSVLTIYLGTNCDEPYWLLQEDYNRANPSSVGHNSEKFKDEECPDQDDVEMVTKWINRFLQEGYLALCVYDAAHRYQYASRKEATQKISFLHFIITLPVQFQII